MIRHTHLVAGLACLALVTTSLAQPPAPTLEPLVRTVDLNIGQSQAVASRRDRARRATLGVAGQGGRQRRLVASALRHHVPGTIDSAEEAFVTAKSGKDQLHRKKLKKELADINKEAKHAISSCVVRDHVGRRIACR